MKRKIVHLLLVCSLVLSTIALSMPTAMATDIITSTSLTSVGKLKQFSNDLQNINFTATATPSADVDLSTIEWYVNDVKQVATGVNFTYKPPMTPGNYKVEAKVSNNLAATTQSENVLVITSISDDNILLWDANTTYGSTGVNYNLSIWDSTATATTGNVTTVADPLNPNNIAAKWWSANAAASDYLQLRENIPMGYDPIVYSGDVLLSSLDVPTFEIVMRTGAKIVSLATIAKNNNTTPTFLRMRVGASGDIARANVNQWVHYVLYLYLHPTDPTQCKVTAYFSGGVKSANGSTSPIAVTTTNTVDLTGINYTTVVGWHMLRVITSASVTGTDYIDNMRFYKPAAFLLYLNKDNIKVDEPTVIKFNHDVNLLTLDKTKVTATKSGGGTVAISSIDVDSLSPNYMVVHFTYPLDHGAAYTIALDNTVLDIAGATASNSITLNTEPLPQYTVAVDSGTGGTVSANPVNATVDEGQSVEFTITPDADYEIGSVTYNGNPVTVVSGGTYTTPALTANATLVVTYTKKVKAVPVITIVSPVHVGSITFNGTSSLSGKTVNDLLIESSYLSYATISNPDHYTLVSYGMILKDLSTGKVIDLPVVYKTTEGQFAVQVYGSGFLTGRTYSLQGYVNYLDDGNVTQLVLGAVENPFDWE